MEFAIFQPKMVLMPWNEKLAYRLNFQASNVTNGFDLGLQFSRSNMEFAISLPKMAQLPWNKKQTYWLNFRPQMWPSNFTLAMTLTDCQETKSKHIDWTPGKWAWPWPWPLHLNFQGQMLPWPFIWWPRSGARIYQIFTGVTSDVGMASTHIVLYVTHNIRVSVETIHHGSRYIILPFHKDFSPSGEQLELRKLAHEL